MKRSKGFIKHYFFSKENNAGFTLIELLVAVGILAVLMVGSTNLFLSSLVGSGKETAVRDIKQNGEFAVVQIETNLRGAASLVTNQFGSECENGMRALRYRRLDGTERELYVSNGRLSFDGSSYLTASNLVVNEDNGSGNEFRVNCRQDLASNVLYVEVVFTLERGGGAGEKLEEGYSQEFTASVTLRNK